MKTENGRSTSVMLIVMHVVWDFGVPWSSQTKAFPSLVDLKSKHLPSIVQRFISPQTSQTANLQLLVSQNLTSAAQWDNLRRGQLSQMQQRTFAPKQAKSHVRVRGQSRVRVVSHSWASTSRPSGVVWVSSVSSVGFGRVGLVCGKTAHFSWRKEEIGGLCWNQEQFK